MNQVTSSTKTMLPQKPLEVDVIIEGTEVATELDTGAAVSLVSKETFTCLWPEHPLQQTTTRLKMYSGEQLAVVGEAVVYPGFYIGGCLIVCAQSAQKVLRLRPL